MEIKSEKYFPFQISNIDPHVAEEIKRYRKGEPGETFVTVGPKKYVYPPIYKEYAADIYNLELHKDDVFIVGLPRSGTNLTQEMAWLLNNDMNFEKALTTTLRKRVPYLESIVLYVNSKSQEKFDTLDVEKKTFLSSILRHPREILEMNPPPRMVKTHLPLSLLPPNLLDTSKVIYVARDPRDVAVSMYHLFKNSMMAEYTCDLKKFFDLFVNGYDSFLPYFEHVKEAWKQKDHPNMFFLFYEEIRKDLPTVVRRIAKFFGKQYSDKQFSRLCDHLSFENIKKNEQVNVEVVNIVYNMKPDDKVNSFVRKGKAGGWKDYFDEEMTIKAERWIAENLQDSDLRFPNVD